MSQMQNLQGKDNPLVGDIETITGNSGGAAGADGAGNFNLTGDNATGINIVTNPGTFSGTVFGLASSTTQVGTVALATGLETTTGTNSTKAVTPAGLATKLGAQTSHGIPYGNATTGAILWLAEAQNGYFPIGSTGNAPVLGTITSLDGSLDVTLGAGTIDIKVSDTAVGTAQTIGAVTGNILSVPLGATPGTFQFEARVKGFESTTPAGAGYNIYATFTTDGVNATLVGDQPVFNEDPALSAGDAYFIASGNNAVLQVLGVVGLTINWSGETQIT